MICAREGSLNALLTRSKIYCILSKFHGKIEFHLAKLSIYKDLRFDKRAFTMLFGGYDIFIRTNPQFLHVRVIVRKVSLACVPSCDRM